MVRISKLTDYAMVIMACMAEDPSRLFQARELAHHTTIAHPTVSKLLKKLTKSKLLLSTRGTHGGYHLACHPEKISIKDLIQALEGPIAITECNLGHNYCPTESHCSVRAPWQRINQVITHALQSVKLSDLAQTQRSVGEEIYVKH